MNNVSDAAPPLKRARWVFLVAMDHLCDVARENGMPDEQILDMIRRSMPAYVKLLRLMDVPPTS
jgi:hypothetical protein